MDALISVALQEIAAEGPGGCALVNLWNRLQSAGLSSSSPPLDPLVKQLLWKLLLSTACLSFEIPNCGAVSCTDLSIQDFQDAEQMDIKIIASEDLRESFLGACDLRHCDAKLSPVQRLILERLGKARGNGVTQYQIGKEFGISGNKLFYIIKSLETRGLVVRQSSIYRGERPIATNLVHLKRFAKDMKLGFQQRFDIQNSSIATLDHDSGIIVTEGESNQVCNVKDVLINDDLPALKSICKKLEETDNKVLVISDLKVSLGYRYTSGHRAWRRILGRLVAAGMVETFDAKVENKVLPCIRLLKPFDPKSFASKTNAVNADDVGLESHPKGTKRGQITEQVVELSMNRQIYDSIKQGGSDGVAVTEIFSRLGISNRKNYFRLTDMIPNHGLRLQVENHKRSTQYRVWAPEDCSDPPVDADCSEENAHKQGPEMPFMRKCKTEAVIPMSDDRQLFPENMWSTDGSDKLVDDKSLVMGLDLVPYTELDTSAGDGDSPVPIRFSGLGGNHDSLPIAFSKCNQRTVALSTAHTQREIWIMERLEKEKFILRSELHKWLEELEDRKNTILDRKTVVRNLQKLQREGRCKCMLVSLPGVSNYGQIRTVDVVLLPSIDISPDMMTEIYERQRAFDMLVRHQSSSRWRKPKMDENIPTLNGVQRMPKPEIVDKGDTLQDNGFISAKLVRCRMLHQFLWLYTSGLTDENAHLEESDALNGGGDSFSLLVAVQSMPLELFLQVIGSAKHIKGLAERCRRGMRLSDLPRKESEALLDLNASGRLAWLVDILRRLKLLRIVMIPSVIRDHVHESPQAGVAYALELNPYIDEPAVDPPSSISAHVLNLGPSPRHYFKLLSKANLEEYWKSLEYFYRGSQSKIARRIFPGSTVPELFGARSWSSLRVMSMEQRTKLHERIGLHDNRRLPYEECVRIARELNLALDQVLGVSYEKNQRIKQQENQPSKDDSLNSSQINMALGPRNISKKCSSLTDGNTESVRLEITKRHYEEHQSVEGSKESGSAGRIMDPENPADMDDFKEDTRPNSVPNIVLKKFRPFRKKKYMWTDAADRVLVACYTRQRAILGARYNRVEWNTIPGLPAPPKTCSRRSVILKMIPAVRKAMMALSNLLATRYTKYLRSHADGQGSGNDSYNSTGEENLQMGCKVYAWDDFEDPSLSAAINHIIRCKNAARSTSLKKNLDISSLSLRSSQVGPQTFPNMIGLHRFETSDVSVSIPATDNDLGVSALQASDESIAGKLANAYTYASAKSSITARSRPNRFNVRKKMQRPIMLKEFGSDEKVQNSIGAAMAVELIKLVFLNSAVESEVSQVLVDALRRCKEADVFTAFNFLKSQSMVAVGDQCHAFVLSPKFYQNSASSPFSLATSYDSKSFEMWFRNMKTHLDEDWVTLDPEPQWGELFYLFSSVLSGQLSIEPFLPQKGIGEKDQDETTRKRKRDLFTSEDTQAAKIRTGSACEEGGFGQRRERGFPGIEVKAHSAVMSLESMLTMDPSNVSLLESYNFSSPPPQGSDPVDALESSELVQQKSLNPSNLDFANPITADKQHMLEWSRLEGLDQHSIDLYDTHEARMLEQVHAAVSNVGEEGIRIGDKIEINGDEGKVTIEITESHARKLQCRGLAREVMAFDHVRIVSAPNYERYFLHMPKSGKLSDDPVEIVPILPWLEADGKENFNMRAALNRRIMGIVMLHPGILEDSIVEQVDVLNPTSCQKLLQLLVLDGHLFVRTREEYDSVEPPCLVQKMLPERVSKRKLVHRRHYFANPTSSSLL